MVPGAGSALTGDQALGVAGLDRGADGVVFPSVISCATAPGAVPGSCGTKLAARVNRLSLVPPTAAYYSAARLRYSRSA